MKKYLVEVSETMTSRFLVEAEDEDDAEEAGKQGCGDLIDQYCSRLDATATEMKKDCQRRTN